MKCPSCRSGEASPKSYQFQTDERLADKWAVFYCGKCQFEFFHPLGIEQSMDKDRGKPGFI